MLNTLQASILIVLFFVGCDSAVKQQQAEVARRAAAAARLKQIGKALHENHNKESAAATPNVGPQGTADSKDNESALPSTADPSHASAGSGDSPAPTE